MFRASCPAAVAIAAVLTSPAARAAVPSIAFEKYTLDNGLVVILHQDDSVPLVHAEVWYRVGSKDESPGRTGFAHLFEHIMFQGTKHIPEDAFFKYLAEAGASNRNGTTSADRTNYYETLPSNQLELALWLESSRMGFLLERPSFRTTFENQREVVKNERRQRVENQPMGDVWRIQLEALFPPGHPYHHEVIGSMADLDAATENDLRTFFLRYYSPNNAILTLAGDFDVARAKELIQRYFGPIPAGPALVRRPVPKVERGPGARIAMEAKINLPAAFIAWESPPLFAPGDAELDVLAAVLAGGKSSRLYQRLVYDMKIAESVSAAQHSMMLAGIFRIAFSPLAGHSLPEIERVVDEELERLRQEPITPRELQRVKNQIRTDYFQALEPIAGRASRLMAYEYHTGDPGYIDKDLARYDAVDAAAVMRAARELLPATRRTVITVEPNPDAPIMGRVKPEAR